MDHRFPRRRQVRGIGGLLLFVWGGMLASVDASQFETGVATKYGTALPALAIPVSQGHARFVVPVAKRTGNVLVVVSSLSREGGPFPLRMRATRSEQPGSPAGTVVEPLGHVELPRVGRRSPPAAPPVPQPAPALRRSFQMLVRAGDPTRPENYLAVDGRLFGFGPRIQVYVDARDLDRVPDKVVQDIITTFEVHVQPTAARLWGAANDIDGDGRLTVLLTSWLDHVGGHENVVDGLFRGADYVESLGEPFSNRCDMIYLNPRAEPGAYLRTVLAHEYAHAVTFSRKCLDQRRGGALPPEEEAWLDESIAHLVEDLHGFSRSNLDHRVGAFLASPERYQLIVTDYYTANLFRSHGHRGSAYLFLRWCADHFGSGLLERLIGSEQRGIASLETATGHSFPDLYRRWSIDLYRDGLRPGAVPDQGRLLAGPRPSRLVPDGSEQCSSAPGTTSRYLLVDGNGCRSLHIEIDGPPDAALQVTAIPLPADLPALDLSARFSRDGHNPQRIIATARAIGAEVHLKGMTWGPLVPASGRRDLESQDGQIARSGLVTSFGSMVLRPGETRNSAAIDLGMIPDHHRAAMVVRLIGSDAQGRRVVGWTVLPATDRTQTP